MNKKNALIWFILILFAVSLNARYVSKSEVLLHYAEKHNITVEDNEVESLFIRELGDHPKVVTNGYFDPDKFEQMKQTPEVKKILKEMKKDILISKTESVVRKQFETSYEELLSIYTAENSSYNIRYSVTDVEDMSVPEDFTAEEALEYYDEYQDEFLTKEKIKLEIVIIPKSEFYDATNEITEQHLAVIPDSVTISPGYRESYFRDELEKAARNRARRIKSYLQRGESVSYAIFESDFIAEEGKIGQLPQELVSSAFQKVKGLWFTYFDEDSGYLICRVTERLEPQKASFDDITNDVWKSYVKHKKSYLSTDKDEVYFYRNLNDFIASAVVTDIIEIPRPSTIFLSAEEQAEKQIKIINELQANNPEIVAEKYKLETSKEIIKLSRYDNNNEVLNMIAEKINSGDEQGFVYDGYKAFMFSTSSYFPEYIPGFESVRNQIAFPEAITDSTQYRKIFEDNKRRYTLPDSLKLGGVFYEANPESVSIPQIEVYNYYKDNLKNYYRENAVNFEYIFVSDIHSAQKALDQLNSGTDFESVKYCFNEKPNLFKSGFSDISSLPHNISNALNRTAENSISQPVAFNNGYLLLKKIRKISSANLSFEEVKAEILSKLRKDVAMKNAQLKAKAFFDSSSYFSHCYTFADSSEVFKTSYFPADAEFEKIGKITKQKKAILRLWRNEKFSSILRTDQGYAVIFMLKKNASRKMTFEEAVPVIQKNINEKTKTDNATAFFNNIRNKISQGANPDSLLTFWGGWKQAVNLNSDSKISGLDFDDSVMNEISKHEEGYLSHTIKLPGNNLFLYKIDYAKKVDLKFFNANFETIKKKNQMKMFENWLNMYKAENF